MVSWPSRLLGLLLPSLAAAAVSADINAVLGPQLSADAQIIWPSDTAFHNATERWSSYHAPTAGVVVTAGTAEDVRLTVAYARNTSTPFLARNTGHGSTGSLGTFAGGILINIGTLAHIAVDGAAQTVTFGGGVYNGELISAVAKAGRETTTGSCGCVGILGAALGGGHGRLQGRHGLIADQIESVKMVTADARMVTVSATENPELLWALKGAGHNFGIVVEATSRVYAPTTDTWAVAYWLFPGNATTVKGIVAVLNDVADTRADDGRLTLFLMYQIDPATLAVQVAVSLTYAGPAAAVQGIITRFDTLAGPAAAAQVQAVPWEQVNDWTGTGVASALCTTRSRTSQYSTSILRYDAATQVQILARFQKLVADNPRLAYSTVIFESYPLQAFQAVPHASTAYGNRDANIVALFGAYYQDSQADLDAVVTKFGVWFRSALAKTGGFRGREVVYVNYAQGDETLAQMYGVEPWRLRRLEALKRKWDPESVFGYYNPIPAGGKY
ncbi:hypothetical protein EDC01DRAFT_344539 [Geopyxis carbonaria]|nr:hypothetical protein EDC01DRAFT_344539 [Geopyxis carbonaria]